MEHPLDNPVWNALISGNSNLSYGTETAKFFEDAVSPFLGLKDYSLSDFELLHTLLDNQRVGTLVSAIPLNIPSNWTIIQELTVLQMICIKMLEDFPEQHDIQILGEQDVDQMLRLTQLTRPGPFERHTIRFGHYEGIYRDNELVAMAGQRLHPNQYAEISAVCTHPDYTGKGLAEKLIKRQIHRIQSTSEIPFLHVLPENERAISLYKKMGFIERTTLYIYIIKK